MRKIKSPLILTGLILILFISIFYPSSIAAKAYHAKVVLKLDWDLEETQKLIIPRDEIRELDIQIIFQIVTDNYIGRGTLLGYSGISTALLDLEIVDTSPWCYAVLRRVRLEVDILEYVETTVKLHLILDETAPAGANGSIKIKASCPPLGLIEGFENVFELSFTPSYKPIIKTNLPDVNTKRIKPTEEAVFPIEIENAGNARTQVLFKIENVPEGWAATIPDEVFLDEAKGSKATAYMTIIPPNQFGFHYDEVNIRVTMIPVRAENPNDRGTPLYATFTVQNRGLSTSGIEQILFIGIIILIILVTIVLILKRRRRRRKETAL